jgi:hypothetical protein
VTRLLENVVLFDAAWLLKSAATGKAHPEIAQLILLPLIALFACCLSLDSLLCATANFIVFEFFYVLGLIFRTVRKEKKKEKYRAVPC